MARLSHFAGEYIVASAQEPTQVARLQVCHDGGNARIVQVRQRHGHGDK